MKIARVGPDEVFHRDLTPNWAFLPTSGAGAGIDGGRFGGVEGPYLSLSAQTALEEYRQGASIAPPATTLAEVADLSDGFHPDSWNVAWKERDCAWRQITRIDKKTPPSWKLVDLVITSGLRGILFPSLRHAGGPNLVVFPANLVGGDHVGVHDPDHRLPQNQSSWP